MIKDGKGTLTLLVVEEDTEFVETKRDAGGYQQHGLGTWIRNVFIKDRAVDLGKVQGELDKMQRQVDTLLDTLDTKERAGFRLTSVDVSLGLSAEGSIGIVTAGAEVAIALSYERVQLAE